MCCYESDEEYFAAEKKFRFYDEGDPLAEPEEFPCCWNCYKFEAITPADYPSAIHADFGRCELIEEYIEYPHEETECESWLYG